MIIDHKIIKKYDNICTKSITNYNFFLICLFIYSLYDTLSNHVIPCYFCFRFLSIIWLQWLCVTQLNNVKCYEIIKLWYDNKTYVLEKPERSFRTNVEKAQELGCFHQQQWNHMARLFNYYGVYLISLVKISSYTLLQLWFDSFVFFWVILTFL